MRDKSHALDVQIHEDLLKIPWNCELVTVEFHYHFKFASRVVELLLAGVWRKLGESQRRSVAQQSSALRGPEQAAAVCTLDPRAQQCVVVERLLPQRLASATHRRTRRGVRVQTLQPGALASALVLPSAQPSQLLRVQSRHERRCG